MVKAHTLCGEAAALALLLVALAGCDAREAARPKPGAGVRRLPPPRSVAPPRPPAEEDPATAASAAAETAYVVRRGDHLWRISGREAIYDAAGFWPVLYAANSGLIADPDVIHPGQKLDVPRFASKAARRDRLFEVWSDWDTAGGAPVQ